MVNPDDQSNHAERTTETHNRQGFWAAMKSVAAAFLGVQSKKNWEEDSQSPSPLRFIVAGLIMGVLFLGIVFTITYVVASFIV